jgi:hypothetical protein
MTPAPIAAAALARLAGQSVRGVPAVHCYNCRVPLVALPVPLKLCATAEGGAAVVLHHAHAMPSHAVGREGGPVPSACTNPQPLTCAAPHCPLPRPWDGRYCWLCGTSGVVHRPVTEGRRPEPIRA